MLEAMKSLRDNMQSIKKSAKEVELDQSSTSASKPGPSKQSDNLPLNPSPNTQSECTDEAMEVDVYGPSLPPRFGDAQSEHGSNLNYGSDYHSDISEHPNRCVRPEPKNIRTNTHTRFGPNIFLSRHPQRRISLLLTRKGLLSPLGPLLN